MKATDYEKFLSELTSTLAADPLVRGLITLGSTADAALRDRWSDHDFWVITARGAQSRYLEPSAWLPQADDILLTVRHGPSGRSVLYANGHQVEYIVFDEEEARGGKIERFRVPLDRGGVGDLAESVRLATLRERQSALARPDRLEGLCMLLWTACERGERGEHLSAQRYLQFSVDAFLDLLMAHAGPGDSPAADGMDGRRRLERTRPELGRELRRITALGPAEAGVALLGLAERELRARAPDLAWDEASVVRRWLRESAEAA